VDTTAPAAFRSAPRYASFSRTIWLT
jgi:hypothetical protein